jgi:hypothetical protein
MFYAFSTLFLTTASGWCVPFESFCIVGVLLSLLLGALQIDESYKKHFIARTGLEHDERSEECPKGVSAITCFINEISYSIFSTLPLFQ